MKLIDAIKSLWRNRELTPDRVSTLAVTVTRLDVAVEKLNRDYGRIESRINDITCDSEYIRIMVQDMLSSTYARIAEQQLAIANKTIERQDETIRQMLDRWRGHADGLNEEIERLKAERESYRSLVEKIELQQSNDDRSLLNRAKTVAEVFDAAAPAPKRKPKRRK